MLGIHHLRSRLERSKEAHPSDLRIAGASLTDVGKVRSVNEDTVLFKQIPGGALALVADGMGGAQGGSLASAIAAQTIPRMYLSSRATPPRALRKAMELANREIYRRAQKEEALAGMGATCIALVLTPSQAWAAWVGDSRLYLIRDQQIFQMTEDHSVVREMVRRGLLDPSSAARHEERNVVTRALGSQKRVDVAVWEQGYPVRAGDRFLLSSDGLHDALSDLMILDIAGKMSIEAACNNLIAAANRRGGHDNISAVLLEITVAQSESPRETRWAGGFPDEVEARS